MKTRKTKKRNIIRRAVAFLLCMTMVLGLGMQDVIDQVYAEETATQTLETQAADTEAAAEESAVPTGEEPTPEETADPEETPAEENETEKTTETPSGPAVDADADTGTEEGKKEQLSTPADSAESTTPADDAQNGSGSETSGETGTEEKTDSETQAPAEDGTVVTNPDETAGDEAEDDAAASDEEEETTEPEEKVTELTYEAEDGSFSVTVAAVGEDTDLSSYELHAARVLADGEDAGRYTAAKELIDGALEAESRKTEELQVYDVWFTNIENGEEADLSGQAELSINYTAPEFPEGTDVQMEVFCLNGGSAEATEGTEALAAGSELYAVAWAVPAGYENVWENDQVIIRVTAEDGVVPEGAELSVTPIVKTEEEELANLPEEEKAKAEDINKQYDETEQKLDEELEAQNAEEMAALAAENASADVNMVSESGDTSDGVAGKKLEGFLAFDISFLVENENGEITEVEPSDKVNVSIEFKQATIPDEVSEDAEVSVAHLKEETNEAGETEIVVEDLTEADTTTVETTDKAEVTKVELVTDSFSTFTIYWSSSSGYSTSAVRIHYVDTNGNDIEKGKTGSEIKYGDDTVNLKDYAVDIPGYTYQYATINTWNNKTHTERIRQTKYGSFQYEYERIYGGKDWEDLEGKREWIDGQYITCYDIYMLYKFDPSSGDITDNEQLGTPEHKKYIKEETRGKDYILTLDVTGERGEKSGIDVLVVIDKSGSMGYGPDSLMQKVKSTIKNSIVNAVLDKPETPNRIAAVTFSSDDYTRGDISTGWVGYNGKTKFNNTVDNISSNGATNWELGMMQAEEMLKESADSENKKVVIFLSDGCPGMYYASYGQYIYETGNNNPDPDWESDDIETARQQAEWYVSSTQYLKNASIYSVYLTDDTKDTMEDFADNLKNNYSIDAVSVDGTNIETSLGDLINSIITPEYTNVVIEDTLSEYVELLDNPEYKVVKTSSNGSETEFKEDVDYTLRTEEVTLDNGEPSTKIILTLENALEDGATYSLSYHVRPSEQAVTTYIEEGGYIHTGDLETDAPGNHTSSDQPGFYSNDNAVVRYKENNGNLQTAKYDKPVVQIDTETIDIPEEPNPIDGSITKTMGKATGDGEYPITLEVKTRLEESSESAKVDVILVIDTSSSMNNNSRMVNTKTAAKEFVKGFVGQEGTVSEIHRVGIVTFATSAQIETYGDPRYPSYQAKYFSGDVNEIIDKIDSISVKSGNAGGTNADAGFTKAETLADKTDNKKYVIFLTDGVPTCHDENIIGGSQASSVDDFNKAVDAAMSLKSKVDGIYTIGLLDGANNKQLDVARTLLASTNPEHHNSEYEHTYKFAYSNIKLDSWTGALQSWDYGWNKMEQFDYSDGYFEVTEDNAETALSDIWTELATIINNQTSGSTGSGWKVIDKMADFTTFLTLEGATINDYELDLNSDGTELTTNIDGQLVKVAEYDKHTKTITWYLSDVLAEKSIKYNHGTDYTYRLTYYVDFEDSKVTELRPTNETTYVETNREPERIYPEKMPFFVNVVGQKVDADDTDTKLVDAEFAVYRDKDTTQLIGTCTSDENGHFAFQLGQSDFDMTSTPGNESYTIKVYLKETKAPEGYVVDETVHPITINVNNVQYQTQNSGDIQKGTPSGTVSIFCQTTGYENLVSVDGEKLLITYKNASRPDWAIVKRNGNNHAQFLEGAEFDLYKVTDDVVEENASFTAVSDRDGVIASWEAAQGGTIIASKDLPTGTYILKEKKAPDGYSKSEDTWEIEITATSVEITLNSSSVYKLTEDEKKEHHLSEDTDYYAFDNVMAYELPSTGGTGIYLYMLGGVALMMAGTLLVYKKRKEEVLRS